MKWITLEILTNITLKISKNEKMKKKKNKKLNMKKKKKWKKNLSENDFYNFLINLFPSNLLN